MRAYKTVNETYIEPVSFVVPRRAEVFQNDIYPPTTGLKPAMSSQEYFAGKTGMPPKISLESLYDGQEPEEVPASDPLLQSAFTSSRKEPSEVQAPHSFQDSKLSMPNTGSDAPSTSQTKDAPASTGTTSSRTDPLLQSASSSSRNESSEAPAPPPHSFQDSKLSMPNTGSDAPSASQARDAPASTGTTSSRTDPLVQSASSSRNESSDVRAPQPHSFKDSKTSMANMASKFADRDGEEDGDDSSSFEEIQKPVERPHAALIDRQEEKTGVKTPSHVVDKEQDSSAAAAPSSPAGGAKGAAEGIRGVLQDMKAMIASQGKQMAEQSEKIEILAREVASMKARLGD